MIRLLAVFTFLLIVGVCSYVVLNPGSYSTLVLSFAAFPCARCPELTRIFSAARLDHIADRQRCTFPDGRLLQD